MRQCGRSHSRLGGSMEQSDKHAGRVDDDLKHELSGMMTSGQQTHVEEWRQVEPSGEDQPPVDRAPEGPDVVGTPEGLDLADVERRSELASYLGKEVWPGDRDALLAHARQASAPDWVMAELQRLPSRRTFVNVNDAWSSLGHTVEQHRA